MTPVASALLVVFLVTLAWIMLSSSKNAKTPSKSIKETNCDSSIMMNSSSSSEQPASASASATASTTRVKGVEVKTKVPASVPVVMSTNPSKAKIKAMAVRNQTNKFKNLSAISDLTKTSCNCFHREIGGHAQAVVDFEFSGNMVATIDTDTVKCVPVSDIGAAAPTDYFCSVDKSQPSSTPASLKSATVCSVAMTQNGKRILTACNSVISFYKVPLPTGIRCDAGSAYGGTDDRRMTLLKQIDCYTPPNTGGSVTAAVTAVTGPTTHQSRPLQYMVVRTLRVMDVEKWMVVVAAGEYTVACTVFSPMQRENVVVPVDIPCVKAFNHAGREIFHYTPVPKGGYHPSDPQALAVGKRSKSKAPGHATTATVSSSSSAGSNSSLQRHYKVTEMLIEVSPNGQYLCVSGAGSLDDNHNTDSQGLCSNDIGVYEVVRSSGNSNSNNGIAVNSSTAGSTDAESSEAMGLKLVFVLSNHAHRICDIAWSFTSTSVVSLVAPLVPVGGEDCGGWYVWDILRNYKNTNTSEAAVVAGGAGAGVGDSNSNSSNSTGSSSSSSERHSSSVSVSAVNPSAVRLFTDYHPVRLQLPDTTTTTSSSGNSKAPLLDLPTSIAVLRKGVDDSIGSLVVVCIEASLYIYGREDNVCLRALPNITLFPIRRLQATMDGMYVASLVKNAKRIPLWKFAVEE